MPNEANRPALLALGGTISMAIQDRLAVPAMGAREIAAHAGLSGAVSPHDVARVGGSEVDLSHLTQLTEAARVAVAAGAPGIIVTTGTDSIEEVSCWLTLTGPWSVPIVVTGSMRAGSLTDTDAIANLRLALGAIEKPVCSDPVVAFAGRIWLGRAAQKTRGIELAAFLTPGKAPLAVLEAGELVRSSVTVTPVAGFGPPPGPLPPIPLVTVFLGDDGALLRHAAKGVVAIVVAGNGAGNVPPAVAAVMLDLIGEDVLVALATRAHDSRVEAVYGYPGGGGLLAREGAVLCDGLTPHHARLALAVAASGGARGAALRDRFTTYLDSVTC